MGVTDVRRWPRALASNDPLAANDVYDPCRGVRAKIRAHKDIQGGVRSVGPSRMDARVVIGYSKLLAR